MTLRDRIRERLAAIGMKPAELVRRSGVPQSTLASIFQRDTRSTPHLIRLAAALKTTPAYLLGETDDPNSEVADFTLSFEEREFIEQVRLLAPEDFTAVKQLVNRLSEPRAGYVYKAETDDQGRTLHDRQQVYAPKEKGRDWGD